MNAFRGVATMFLLALVSLCILGWRWSATLPVDKMTGARWVLAASALSSLVGLGVIWTIKSRPSV